MNMAAIKRIKRKNEKQVVQNEEPLFSLTHRAQLDQFVSRVLMHIQQDLGVRYEDLLGSYRKMMCPDDYVEHSGDELELEYLIIDSDEYLFHQDSKTLFSYNNEDKPKKIGKYDPESGIIKLYA